MSIACILICGSKDFSSHVFAQGKNETFVHENVDNQAPTEFGKSEQDDEIGLQDFLDLFSVNSNKQLEILNKISSNWSDEFYAPLLDLVRLTTDDFLLNSVKILLEEKSGGEVRNYYDGLRWIWTKNFDESDFYPELKAELYQYLDRKFKNYFKGRSDQAKINFDEILWGGVKQDGIPPLRYPKMLESDDARYLQDDDFVFGIYINGIARAYPKRILAWHEFFVDSFGETKVAGVYCTLCGTVIAYDMTHNGEFYNLGTSGFLYRSNKLMYDQETQSLWNTIQGEPVVGPLVDKNIKLKSFPVVSTTWKQWRKMHPDTEVLSLDTGYDRNYDEGVAYNSYFSTDELMFPVPSTDNRLKNKAEVFVLKVEGYEKDPIAISIDYLRKYRLYQSKISNIDFLVIAEHDGLSRAYNSDGIIFKSYRKGKLIDSNNEEWVVGENKILSPSGKSLSRLSGHNVFWFAWYNSFKQTRLIY